MRLLWIAGAADAGPMAEAARDAGATAVVLPYCDAMGSFYGSVDLLLARSGGGTVAEVAALGLPAVFVPYPHHADRQQSRNAEALEARGGALVVEEADLGPAAFERTLLPLLADGGARGRLAAAARACGRPDAAERVARLVMDRMGAAAGATATAPAVPAMGSGERRAGVLA